MAVSVIIPARNAAATIAETLDSLLAQTHPHWQAIVIDDGSTDETRRIAKSYAARDSRLRVIKGRGRGVSAARNRGIAATRFPWIYFLDADDTITPETLARMVETLAADAAADAVHCGWIYTDPEGREIGRNRCDEQGPDLFALFARYCAVAIHACMIRRALIERVGDFDETLRTSEDHDLWQRAARAGCRFVPLNEYLVRYRLRPQASWFDAQSFTQDVLQVIRRGHTIDPRLAPGIAAPIHAEGAPKSALPEAEFLIAAWAGAMAIARETDPLPVLDLLGPDSYPLLNSEGIAYTLFRAIPFTLCRAPEAWLTLWQAMRAPIEEFLGALEEKSGTRQLKERASRQLEHYVVTAFVDHGEARFAAIGAMAAARIDITEPISDLVLPETERLVCVVQCEGETLGTLTLPVCNSFMPAGVIADAIAARHAWALLRKLFERQIYPSLTIRQEDTGWRVSHGAEILASGLAREPDAIELHEWVGWAIFAQELTGLRGWPIADLYNGDIDQPGEEEFSPAAGTLPSVELARPLPTLWCIDPATVECEVLVGGKPAALIQLPPHDGMVRAGAIRAAALDQGKMELAHVAVREAILGRPLDDPAPLRQRLRERADAAGAQPPLPASEAVNGSPTLEPSLRWTALAASVAGGLLSKGKVLAIGSAPAAAPSSDRRRSMLPIADPETSLQGLEQDQPAIMIGDGELAGCIYLPELRSHSAPAADNGHAPSPHASMTSRLPILMYHRVAPEGHAALARWRVTPTQFDAQLRHLRDAAYEPATLEEWRRARAAGMPLPGRRVLITFDDGYVDLAEHAMPVLRRYGFGAMVFLPTEYVGDCSRWDAGIAETARLMDWDTIRALQAEGIIFGSHSSSHRRLTDLGADEIVREAQHSRLRIKQELGFWTDSIAYPSGAFDEVVTRLFAACGYAHGLTTRPGLSRMDEGDLSLSRVEVLGSHTLEQFAAALSCE